VYAQFANAVANRFNVAKVAKACGSDASQDAGFSLRIAQIMKLALEEIGQQNLEHGNIVSNWILKSRIFYFHVNDNCYQINTSCSADF
jgi:hypothetical protein